MVHLEVRRVEERLGTTFDSTTTPTDVTVSELVEDAAEKLLKDTTYYYDEENLESYTPNHIINPGNLGRVDGVNKTFYVRHLPLVDFDGDGMDDHDLIVKTYDPSTDIWDENVSVDSIDQLRGKVILTTAPASGNLIYASYRAHIAGYIPGDRIREDALFNLVAMEIFRNPNAEVIDGLVDSYSIDGVSFTKSRTAIMKESSRKYKEDYDDNVRKITDGGEMSYG